MKRAISWLLLAAFQFVSIVAPADAAMFSARKMSHVQTSTTYATLNNADKSSSIALFDGNLTATGSSAAWQTVRATIACTVKCYWEVRANSTTSGAVVGISASSTAYPIQPASAGNSYGYDCKGCASTGTGRAINLTTYPDYGAVFTDNDVIGFKYDAPAGTLELLKNNSSQGVAFTGISGTYLPYVSCYGNGCSLTANFGASAFVYSVPAGYVSGVY